MKVRKFLGAFSGALALVLASAPAFASTGACGAASIAPAASSYNAAHADDGTIISPKNATGAASGWATKTLVVNLPTVDPSDANAGWTLCATSDSNNAVIFSAPLLAAPGTPVVNSTSGGSLGARTEYYKLSYVNSAGETVASVETSAALGANTLAVVSTPGAFGNATGYNVYAATGTGLETKQNAAPISLASNWTEPTGGLISGSSPLATGTAPSAYILYGGQTLQKMVLGPDNYEYASVQSDGTNYRVPDASLGTNYMTGGSFGFQEGGRRIYPGGPGYQTTQADNGDVIVTDSTVSGLAITLPSTTSIKLGWSIGVEATTQGGSLTVNGVSGGNILYPDGSAVTSYAFAAGRKLQLQFDGANFRLSNSYLTPAALPTNPIIYVGLGGTATGLACANSATPCGTILSALQAIAVLGSGIYPIEGDVTIQFLDQGPYDGGYIVGTLSNRVSNVSLFTPRIIFEGVDATHHTVIKQPVGGAYGLGFSRGDYRLWHIDVRSNQPAAFALVAGNYATVSLWDTTIGKTDASTNGEALLAFQFGQIFFSDDLSQISGAWSEVFEGELDGYFDFDSHVITCSGVSFSDAFVLLQHSDMFTSGTTWSGCPTTGTAVHEEGTSAWKRSFATDYIPGATYRMLDGQGFMAGTRAGFTPTLTSCTNGALTSGSTQWTGRILFTGSASTCTVTYAVPDASNTSPWANIPICTTSANNMTPFVGSTLATGTTYTGSFVNGTALYYSCRPFNDG